MAHSPRTFAVSSRVGAFALFLSSLGASCWFHEGQVTPQPQPPPPPASMFTDSPLAAADESSPFGVVYAGPKVIASGSHIQVVFNRPMRSLLSEAPPDASGVALFAEGSGAPLPQKLRFLGAHVLDIEPQGPLPPARRLLLRLSPGTRAADGSAIKEEFRAVLSSPPPMVTSVSPTPEQDALGPSDTFVVSFNMPVSREEAERAISLLVGPSGHEAPWPVQVRHSGSDADAHVEIVPQKKLPPASGALLRVDGSLRAREGTLAAGAHATFAYRTFEPLRILGISCDRKGPEPAPGAADGRPCDPESVTVELSNNVEEKDFFAHATLDGEPLHKLDWGTSMLSVLNIAPALSLAGPHTLVIRPGLLDEYGQSLGSAVTLSFSTAAPRLASSYSVHTGQFAEVSDSPRYDVFESGEGGDIARKTAIQLGRAATIRGRGLSSYELLRLPLDEELLLTAAGITQVGWNGLIGPRGFDALRGLKGALLETKTVTDTVTDFEHRVPLDAFVAAGTDRAAGAVAVRFDTPDGKDAHARLMTVTNLAITARLSRTRGLVWVTRISDGKPVSGAEVSLKEAGPAPHKTWFSGKTDASGFVTVPGTALPSLESGTPTESMVVLARKGSDFTFRRADDEPQHWSYSYSGSTSFDGAAPAIGVAWPDRGVYRPGEIVYLHGVIRGGKQGPGAVPKGEQVTVKMGGYGEPVTARTATLDAFGAFTLEHAVPESQKLGSVPIRVILTDSDTEVAQSQILIADYQAAEMAVRVTLPKDGSLITDPKAPSVPFTVLGEYLFGGAVPGQVRYTTQVRPEYFPHAPDGLHVGADPSASAGGTGSGAARAELADGSFTGSVSLEDRRLSPVRVLVEAEVTDASHRAVASRASSLIHLQDVYLGIVYPGPMESGKTTRIQVAAMDLQGKLKKGVPIGVQLVAEGGAIKASCEVVSDDKPTGCDVAPKDPGRLGILASAQDSRGRRVVSALNVTVAPPKIDPPSKSPTSGPTPAAEEPEEEVWGGLIDLVKDRETYEVGDTAVIRFDSPFPEAEMLVSIEREGVIRHEHRTIRGQPQTLRVPITKEMAPNAFVAVHVHQGWRNKGPKSAELLGDEMWTTAPGYRAAVAELVVKPEASKLSVEIAARSVRKDGTVAGPSAVFGPGDTLDAEILVKDAKGATATGQLTFWVVDEGVLMLTGYQPPDVHNAFSAPRPSGIRALETRDTLGTPASEPHIGYGFGLGGGYGVAGGTAALTPRIDRRATAYYAGALPIGADGKAHARFTLPDSLTQMRLMAVAVTADDRFGQAESHVTVTRPLVLREVLPKMLRVGDHMEIGAIVTAPSGRETNVTVGLEAKGLSLSGETQRTVKLPAGGSAEVRFSADAKTETTAKLTFTAQSGLGGDALVVDVPVRSPVIVESFAVSGSTAGRATEELGDLTQVHANAGGLTVRLGRGELLGLGEGMRDLVEYPYGCTEQLTSRLVPLLPLASLARKLRVPMPTDLPVAVDRAVRSISSHQRQDGSFGYWQSDRTTRSQWLTAYALFGLDLAKKHGHKVSEEALSRAAAALSKPQPSSSGAALTERAFVLDVLATAGRPDIAALKALAAQRGAVPLFGRALVAHAMAVAGQDRTAAKSLIDDAGQKLRALSADAAVVEETLDSSYDHLLPSPARTTSAVLRALIAIDDKDPLIRKLARGLLRQKEHKGGWRSTHEAAWALIALDEYAKSATAAENEKGQARATVALGGTDLWSAKLDAGSSLFEAKTLTMPELLAIGKGTLSIRKDEGEGAIYYEARLRFAPKSMPATPADHGILIDRSYRIVTPDKLTEAANSSASATTSTAKRGDLVLVEVHVTTPVSRDQVVVEDPLPSGLTAIQTAFRTTARDLSLGTADARYLHREIHDDRVVTFAQSMAPGLYTYRYLARATTIGAYPVPPARAEDMYHPDVYGRTAAGTFTVTP